MHFPRWLLNSDKILQTKQTYYFELINVYFKSFYSTTKFLLLQEIFTKVDCSFFEIRISNEIHL